MVTQSRFYISCLVKSLLHQLLDPLLRGWPHNRCKTHIPLRRDFVVRRQTGHVDESFGLADCLLVERCDAVCQRFDESIKVGIGKGRLRPYRSARRLGCRPRRAALSASRPIRRGSRHYPAPGTIPAPLQNAQDRFSRLRNACRRLERVHFRRQSHVREWKRSRQPDSD